MPFMGKISFTQITAKLKDLEHRLLGAANINMPIVNVLSYCTPL